MTKAALRRQERERQARAESDSNPLPQALAHEPRETSDAITEASSPGTANIPHMEPPPPYDAPHLPRRSDSSNDRPGRRRHPKDKDHPGCLNFGPGESEGCLNYNSGKFGPEYKVYGCLNYDNQDGCLNFNSGYYGTLQTDGCLNYDSRDGCMNYRSEDGCMNFESTSGCMNYRSHGGCMNYEVGETGGCLNFRTNSGGCLQRGRS